MTAAVVDASVGVKWFLPEVHAAEARQWRKGPDELHVPAFFFDLEIANILWKESAAGRDYPRGRRIDPCPTPCAPGDPTS